ncbi:hypothetical protein CC77DRAFT_699854 [Alternaria alternata]|uniref:Secreted protein n=1 Tax=Alternaria alternata TaxID=5599 RepID=A0A177DVF4_ALTAL|nr:hypothetical protein CC77DRAFT_699854 [Alternaria alternata]OAG23190.1 hypothetical protein CC77DRAFT_699854 [Alternaria alternata]
MMPCFWIHCVCALMEYFLLIHAFPSSRVMHSNIPSCFIRPTGVSSLSENREQEHNRTFLCKSILLLRT